MENIEKGGRSMKKGRRNHSAEFKARVALEAIKGIKSMAEMASEYDIIVWKI